VSPYRRKGGASYYITLRWKGWPKIRLATGTSNKSRAIAMERTLHALKSAGRRDLLELVAGGRLRLDAVHDAYTRNPAELEQLRARVGSPRLGDLVDRWLAWLRSPAGVSPRTKRRYAPRSVDRYAVSWEGFFAVLARGREATLSDLTRGFVLDYRRSRIRATGGRKRLEAKATSLSAATLSRDLAALGAFLTWVRDVEGLTVERPRMPRERESRGRERWFSGEELGRFAA
jgi:hypothetical protein